MKFKIALLLFSLFTLLFSLFTLPRTVSAQTSTESAQVNYQPINVNSITPQSPMYANLMVNNLLHAFSCLMAGASPIGQPCIDYLNGVPVISQADTSGGLLGAVANLNTIVIANPPIRTGQYLATIGDSLGITKEAHAQVGGSGAGVLEPIIRLWQVSRNIAYITMIIIFVIIGLMVMFRQRINPQTVITAQAALPGLVIGLIMITFSYFFASLLTDTAYLGINLVGYYFSLAQTGSVGTDAGLSQQAAGSSAISVFSNFIGTIGVGDIATALSTMMENMNVGVQNMIRLFVGLAAYQYGQAVGQPLGAITGTGLCAVPALATIVTAGIVPFCGLIGGVLGGLAGGVGLAVKAASDPPGAIAWVLYVASLAVLIYTMIRLLFKLINNYLSIIFYTITAPFHFLAASLPGREGVAIAWIRNMLCNILAFPAVMAVLYFVGYLLNVQGGTNYPFTISQQLNVTGDRVLPLFGGLDINFIRLLLGFGALLATPSIPDIICRAVGQVGAAGQLIGQEISGATRAGQGYAGQIPGNVGRVSGSIQQAQQAYYGQPPAGRSIATEIGGIRAAADRGPFTGRWSFLNPRW